MKVIAFLIALVVSGCAQRIPAAGVAAQQWSTIGYGKGVAMTKIKTAQAEAFVFYAGTNRQRYTSEFAHNGVRFDSIEAALPFIHAKPADVLLYYADGSILVDDAKVILKASAEELRAFEAACKKGLTSR